MNEYHGGNEYLGGCLCGQVRFRITAEPIASRVCWCKDCQHLAGNGTVNAVFPTDKVIIQGTLAEYIRTAESGNEVCRRFCPSCGSQLFANSTGRHGFTVVRVGTLDNPSQVRPTANIWSSSAPSWACLDSRLERIDKAPSSPPPKSAA